MKQNFYSFLGEVISRYKGRILIMTLVLSIVPALLVRSLEIRTDYAELISQDSPQQVQFNKYLKGFGASEALYAFIESDRATEIADAAYPKLKALLDSKGKKIIKKIRYKINLQFLYQYGLLLAPEAEFQKAKKELTEQGPFLTKIALCKDLPELIDFFTASMKEGNRKLDIAPTPEEKAFLKEFIENLKNSIQAKGYSLPKVLEEEKSNSFYGIDEKGYFSLPGPKKNVLMQIFPVTTADDYEPLKVFLRGVEKIFKEAQGNIKGVVAFSGSPKLTVDEIEDSDRDMRVLSIISVIGVTLIFMFFFGRFYWPLMGIIVLGLAVLWTFGFAVLFFGYLNIISIVFAVVLVGLGVDFGIHFIERYAEVLCLRGEILPDEAAKEAILKSGIAITASALTTSAAFYISAFSGFKGSYQLGILAGTGILICLAFMLIILPSSLLVLERHKKTTLPEVEHCSDSAVIEVVRWIIKFPYVVIVLTLLASLWASFSLFKVPFDSNLLNLQKEDSEAVKLEKKLMEKYGLSSRFAIILKDKLDRQEISQLVEKLKKVPSVNPLRIESIASLLPLHQESRLAEIRKIAQKFPSSDLPALSLGVSPQKLRKALMGLMDQCDRRAAEAGRGNKREWASYLDSISDQIDGMLEVFKAPDKGSASSLQLEKYQRDLLGYFRELFFRAKRYLHAKKLTIDRIPPTLKDYFISPKGMTAVYIYPSQDVREPENLRQFVAELKEVEPHVTGPSVQTYEVVQEMKIGYQKAGGIALVVVFLILLLEFGSLYVAFLATFPLVLGALIMVGIMDLGGLAFNPANLMALPLLFGVGVDNSIHILHRYCREGEQDISHIIKFTGKAILITSLTTGLGFGCLALGPVINYLGEIFGFGSLVAGHRGLSSLGLIMTLGVFSCLFTSLVFLPCLLKVLPPLKKKKTQKSPKETSL